MKTVLLVALVALGGCMRIYPDPELPDVKIEWYEDCEGTTPDVLVTLTSVEDGSVIERTAACEAMALEIPDVKRHRYEVKGELLSVDGGVFARDVQEVDLRNGVNDSAYLYFGNGSSFRVAWEFDMGASCESLEANWVSIDFYDANDQVISGNFAPCLSGIYVGFPGNSVLGTVALRAVRTDTDVTVAVSPHSAPFMYDPDQLTDVGTLVLTPCGSSCP